MTLFVCTVCCDEEGQEAQGCTFTKPKTRDFFPILCNPDNVCRLRKPQWEEEPERKQAKIS
jgi:hypothetical protein